MAPCQPSCCGVSWPCLFGGQCLRVECLRRALLSRWRCCRRRHRAAQTPSHPATAWCPSTPSPGTPEEQHCVLAGGFRRICGVAGGAAGGGAAPCGRRRLRQPRAGGPFRRRRVRQGQAPAAAPAAREHWAAGRGARGQPRGAGRLRRCGASSADAFTIYKYALGSVL